MIRPELASERTFLAYGRTSLALLVGAVTARHLLSDPGYQALGVLLGFLGVAVLVFGAFRFVSVKRAVERIGQR